MGNKIITYKILELAYDAPNDEEVTVSEFKDL